MEVSSYTGPNYKESITLRPTDIMLTHHEIRKLEL